MKTDSRGVSRAGACRCVCHTWLQFPQPAGFKGSIGLPTGGPRGHAVSPSFNLVCQSLLAGLTQPQPNHSAYAGCGALREQRGTRKKWEMCRIKLQLFIF